MLNISGIWWNYLHSLDALTNINCMISIWSFEQVLLNFKQLNQRTRMMKTRFHCFVSAVLKQCSCTLKTSCFARMWEMQSPGWGKLLAFTSRLFISVASVKTSLSKTGTGRAHPGGRIGSTEKLGEKWTNEMGLPPLSGCLWDSPPQPGESGLMIVVGEMRERRRSRSSKLHVAALVSCVTLFSEGGGTSKSHGGAWSVT